MNAGNFFQNLASLQARGAFTAPVPADLLSPSVLWRNRAGALAAGGDYQENGILYHSRRDPQREARRQLESVFQGDGSQVSLVCIGAGLGYLIKAAFAAGVRDILLIEPHIETLFYLLNAIEPQLLQSLKLTVHCAVPTTDTLEDILPWLQGKNTASIRIYQHRAAFQAFPELYLPLAERFKNLLEKRAINQATIVKFQGLWNRNILLNSKALLRAIPYSRLLSEICCDNIVVAGAGPSLGDSIPQLLKHRKKFLLFAADTAFIPLARGGVIPDLVFSADPQFLNHYFVWHKSAVEPLWVIDPVVVHHIPHFLLARGARLAAWNNVFMADVLLREISGDRGEIAHGGSVSTNAFDAARKIAKRNVILVGQDLSFPGKTAHTKGAALENMVFLGTNRFQRMEAHNLKQMNALPKLPVATVSGEPAFTNAKLKVFIDWFEQQALLGSAAPRLCNATLRGVKLRGFFHATLDALLEDTSAAPPLPMFAGQAHLKDDKLAAIFRELRRDIRALRDIYRDNMILMDKLQQQPKDRNVLDRLAANDQEIKKRKKANDLLALNAQSVILRITEGGDVSRPEELYLAMARSAQEQDLLLKKAIHALEYRF